ncbi:metal ABC transporter solute-binding protein, Zn/Mn family [Marininema halotolerans]|uniref:Zinc transport system substrate-binding protein n=1 Tax=Marininema halotolerans TaxID=1155944 RepID=A0A1I6RD20_9BACL|nr:zinc ABC transporter substrate-binding protein [Marininema halotolerans]SFS62545.1 zinc transport system substrate-binding protein [Marininema halotolerans]
MAGWRYGFILGLLVLLVTAGCTTGVDIPDKKGKVLIYTSFYPLADFAKKIGGHHVMVKNMVPPGVEPHDYEPKIREIAPLSDADLFIYNGIGLESWIEKAKPMLQDGNALVVNASQEVETSVSGQSDPHVWLDPIKAEQQAQAIEQALIKKDPKHKKEYERNYANLVKKFMALDQKFKKMVKDSNQHTFITSHAAFSHLAARYGLTQIAVSGLSPSDEPSAKELQTVIQQARKYDVHYIYFEELVSGKVAETVREEIGAKALTLNPVEGITPKQQNAGEDYFSLMNKNADNLAKGLSVKESGNKN